MSKKTKNQIGHRKTFVQYFLGHWQLYLMIAFPIIMLFIFAYAPMYGVILAFKDYKVSLGIWNSPWAANHGWYNFIRFFDNYNFKECLRNTIVLSIYSMIVSMPCSIILALSLNYAKNLVYKKFVQMVSYCPYFISTIVFVGIINMIFDNRSGVIGSFFFNNFGINILGNSSYFPSLFPLQMDFSHQLQLFKLRYYHNGFDIEYQIHIENSFSYLKSMAFSVNVKRKFKENYYQGGFRLDIRVLQYFLAVAREESITKAAETLRMTQPPLSRQLKDLEEELGKQLLIRGSKKITLTEDGMLLRKRAEELVDLMEKTKAELTSSRENVCGDIYIGCGETESISFLAQAACDLQKKHPLIHYHIYSGDAERVMEKLDKGLIDFGLLVGEADMSKYDYLKLPQKDIWGVLMRKDSPLAEKETICAEDLRDKPLIVSHQTSINTEMFRWLKTDISKLNIVATYDLIYNAAQFVKKGFGYVIALDKLINTAGDSNLCFKQLSPALEAELCIVWKKYQVLSKASSVFLQQLKTET